MKEIIVSIVERLFDNVPFSKKEENLKDDVQKGLLKKYDAEIAEATDEDTDELRGTELVAACKNIHSACESAECDNSDVDECLSMENVLRKRDASRIVRMARRYIYIQSICVAIVTQMIVSLICHFSVWTLVGNLVMTALWSGIFYFVTRRKKMYLLQREYAQLRYDKRGRAYFYQMTDRYSKKFLNATMLCMAMLAYIIIAVVLSVVSSRYTFAEVSEQISYMSIVFEIIFFLFMKECLCKHLVDIYFVEEKRAKFNKQLRFVVIASAVYFLLAGVLLVLCRNRIDSIYNWVLGIGILYFIACVLYDLTLRKDVMFQNVIVNMRKISVVSILLVLFLTYRVMSMDFFFTQPYINKVSRVMEHENPIQYNEENGVYTIAATQENFKILQLTDIHLGGSVMSVSKDLKALDACYKLIRATKPDFVVVTGDLVFPMGVMSFSLNNNAPIMQFANFMRNTGIPWAFTYGNHDTENMATLSRSEFDTLMKSLSYKSTGNLLYPYIQPDIYGRNNQMIEIRNQNDGHLMQALFLLDSNDYIENSGKINEYDYIHDDQVEWYKKNVTELSEKEGYTIPSMLFFHIPLQEYKTANDLYESGSSDVKYFYGKIGETMIDKICCSKYKSKLFDTAVALGSTKAMFCGHDHYNNQSIEYKGIRLSYGYSIDYLAMPGIAERTEQRGATLIAIDQKGGYNITPYRLKDLK